MEGPLWFAADLPVETAGLWEFTLTMDAPLGREEVTFPVAVQGPGGVSLTLIALIVVALATVWLYAWQSNVWPTATSFASRPGFKLGRRQP